MLKKFKSIYLSLYYPCSILLIVAIWVVCMIPMPETPLSDFSFIDKWTHFVMYGSLTLCLFVEYAVRHRRLELRRLFVGAVVLPVVMGVLIEVAQATLTTCRSGDVWDAICNSLGVLLGAITGSFVASHLRKKH